MKKQLITTVTLFITLAVLLSGCNEQSNNNNNNSNSLIDNIELVGHHVDFLDDIIEVNGVMRNKGSLTVDVVAEVLFYNAVRSINNGFGRTIVLFKLVQSIFRKIVSEV